MTAPGVGANPDSEESGKGESGGQAHAYDRRDPDVPPIGPGSRIEHAGTVPVVRFEYK